MALVSDKLCSQFDSEQITSDEIWSKLRQMFDLNAVDDREEVIPFTLEEKEFSLPRRDFNSLILEKQRDIARVLNKSLWFVTHSEISRISLAGRPVSPCLVWRPTWAARP